MNLSEKDLDNFIEWMAKQEALDIFGADHEVISADYEYTGYDDDDRIYEVELIIEIAQHSYDDISPFSFVRTLSRMYSEDDFIKFYKQTNPIKLVEV